MNKMFNFNQGQDQNYCFSLLPQALAWLGNTQLLSHFFPARAPTS